MKPSPEQLKSDIIAAGLDPQSTALVAAPPPQASPAPSELVRLAERVAANEQTLERIRAAFAA